MVSMSMTCMSLNPDIARFFRISQPSPPAPITRTLDSSKVAMVGAPGTKSGSVEGPALFKNLSIYR